MTKKIVKKNNTESTKQTQERRINSLNVPWWMSLIIIIASCSILYYPVINYNLVECDDHEIIFKDFDRISQIDNWYKEFSKSYMYNSYYRPLVTISFMLNVKMSGHELWSYHLTNLIIHIINACLIFYLLSLFEYKKLIPLLGGLIYAVHPLFTNAVAWIVGRNDLLFSMFFLISFIFLIQYLHKQKHLYLILHIISFFLSLFSKETSVFAALIFVAYILIVKNYKINERRTIIFGVTWLIPIITWFVFHSLADLGKPVYKSGLDVFVFNLRVVPEFIAKFFIPVHLSVLPTYSLLNTVLGLGILLIIIFAIIRLKNLNNRKILFGAFWFLIIIVPGMFLTLLNAHQWNEYLECRGYLAMFGLLIILFEILYPIFEKYYKINLVTGIVILSVLSYFTYFEKQNYKDAPTYYESAVEDDGSRANFQYLAGQVYINNLYKKTKNPEYLTKAENFFKAAMALRPNYAMYYRSMAAIYTFMSRHDLALTLLEKALSLDSNQIDTYNGLGYSYYYMGRFNDEIKVLTIAINKWPENQDIIYNLAIAYFAVYNTDSALSLVRYSYKLDKGEKNSYELYYLLNKWGGTYIQRKYFEQGVGILRYAAEMEHDRYAAYENLMNYYLIVYNRPDSAAFFARKLIERGREIEKNKMEFLKPYFN